MCRLATSRGACARRACASPRRRSCGLTVDVECVTGAAPCLDAPNAAGFVVDAAEVTFWGLCPTCQSEGEANEQSARA